MLTMVYISLHQRSNTPPQRSLTTQQSINPSDQARDAALRMSQVSIASGFNRRYGETPSPISLNVAEGGAAVREYLCNKVTATYGRKRSASASPASSSELASVIKLDDLFNHVWLTVLLAQHRHSPDYRASSAEAREGVPSQN